MEERHDSNKAGVVFESAGVDIPDGLRALWRELNERAEHVADKAAAIHRLFGWVIPPKEQVPTSLEIGNFLIVRIAEAVREIQRTGSPVYKIDTGRFAIEIEHVDDGWDGDVYLKVW